MRVRRCRRGFTLVELLTVIGIIALLIGIIMPSLVGARRQAKMVACLARQHEIANAAAYYLPEHQNYYPLAGILQTTNTLEGVGDTKQKKYVWHLSTKSIVQMSFWHEAIASGMGVKLVDHAVPTNAARWFNCPSMTSAEREPAIFYVTTELPEKVTLAGYSTYVINEAMFGWNDSVGRLRGQASRVRRGSETVMVMDGLRTMKRGKFGDDGDWGEMTVVNNVRPPVTLGDALADNGKAGSSDNFDQYRHNGRMNILMMDGHAESRKIAEAALADVFLIAN